GPRGMKEVEPKRHIVLAVKIVHFKNFFRTRFGPGPESQRKGRAGPTAEDVLLERRFPGLTLIGPSRFGIGDGRRSRHGNKRLMDLAGSFVCRKGVKDPEFALPEKWYGRHLNYRVFAFKVAIEPAENG